MQFEVGRKKHPGRESSAALIVPLDVRSALFPRSAYYSCSVSPGSWNTAPAWGWSWHGLCPGAVPWLFPPRGTSHQSQLWCLVPAFGTTARAAWVIFSSRCSSFVPLHPRPPSGRCGGLVLPVLGCSQQPCSCRRHSTRAAVSRCVQAAPLPA